MSSKEPILYLIHTRSSVGCSSVLVDISIITETEKMPKSNVAVERGQSFVFHRRLDFVYSADFGMEIANKLDAGGVLVGENRYICEHCGKPAGSYSLLIVSKIDWVATMRTALDGKFNYRILYI